MFKIQKKFIFPGNLKNIKRERAKEYLQGNVFDTDNFKEHVSQVAINLNIDESIVRDVLVSYFTNIFYLINTVRKIKTKINIYGYFSLTVERGRRF
jgi:hypothetical protein